MKDREIASLREQVEQANPPKRRKVAINPNNRFASFAEILSQNNREPSQRARKARSATQVVEERSSEEEAEQALVRRSARDRRPTQRYLDRDLSVDEESN